WTVQAQASTVAGDAVTAVWARAHLRDLEDRFASLPYGQDHDGLEQRIVATSLRFGVLCRFTAWVAVDERVVTEGGEPHRVVQPVELPSGWEPPEARPATAMMSFAAPAPAAMDGRIGGLAAPAAGGAGP